jgi:hypothetical protein
MFGESVLVSVKEKPRAVKRMTGMARVRGSEPRRLHNSRPLIRGIW